MKHFVQLIIETRTERGDMTESGRTTIWGFTDEQSAYDKAVTIGRNAVAMERERGIRHIDAPRAGGNCIVIELRHLSCDRAFKQYTITYA